MPNRFLGEATARQEAKATRNRFLGKVEPIIEDKPIPKVFTETPFDADKRQIRQVKPISSPTKTKLFAKGVSEGFEKIIPVKKFFEPKPKVRARDFLRELPSAVGKVSKDIAQSIARSFLVTGQAIFDRDINAEFTPRTKTARVLTGTKEPISFETIGREMAGIIGKDKSVSSSVAIPIGILTAGLDTVPGGFFKKSITTIASKVAKLKNVDEIAKVLKTVVKTDDVRLRSLAEGFSKIDNPKVIKKALQQISKGPKISSVATKIDDIAPTTKNRFLGEVEPVRAVPDTIEKELGKLIDKPKKIKAEPVKLSRRIEKLEENITKSQSLVDEVVELKRTGVLNSQVLKGIKNNPTFKKQGAIKDIAGEGFLLSKNKRFMVAEPKLAKKLQKKGWEKIIEIDSLASEAGFERGLEYLEKQLLSDEVKGLKGIIKSDTKALSKLSKTAKTRQKLAQEKDISLLKGFEKGAKSEARIAKKQIKQAEIVGIKKGKEKLEVEPKKKVKTRIIETTGQKKTTTLKAFNQRIKDLSRGAIEGSKATRKEIKVIQTEMINLASNLPLKERGKFLKAVKNANNVRRATKLAEKLLVKITTNRRLLKEAKLAGTTRSKIAFMKKLGEFNNTVIQDIKKQLDIKKPIRKMSQVELNRVFEEAKNRLRFKTGRGFRPALAEPKKVPVFTDDFYRENAIPIKPFDIAKKKFGELGKKTKLGFSKTLAPISTRLELIDISLKRSMRKFEFDNLIAVNKRRKITKPYLRGVKNMSNQDYAIYDLALKNRDLDKIKELNKKYLITKQYDINQKMLDNIYEEAKAVNMDIRYLNNYAPRIIDDIEGFMEHFRKREDWGIFDEAIKEQELKFGRVMTEDEKATLINSAIRGYGNAGLSLRSPGFVKDRKIDFINGELNQFYKDSGNALAIYIDRMTDAIESRKFFGKEMQIDGQTLNIEDSIGSYVTKLLSEGKIKPRQERELKEILNARFNPKGPSAIGTVYKNLTYIDVMGSPLNAITQIGDLAFPLYKNGIVKTIKGLGKATFNKTAIKKEDIGIEQIAQEFNDRNMFAGAVTKVFKLIGLEKIDTIGKNTLIESSLVKFTKQAKNNDPKLLKELKRVFETDDLIKEVLNDLKTGNNTENVKYLMFNNLLDFQPVALSEMPEKYLTSGNGRILYTLKTWSIKAIDVFRREAFQKIKVKETRAEGIRNLMKLSASLIVMNATADVIKDLIMGKEIELDDLIIDNIAKLFGINKYTLDVSVRDGLGKAVIGIVAPPTQFIDNSGKDLTTSIKAGKMDFNELRTIKSVPVVGKLYYWWFGRGTSSPQKKSSGGRVSRRKRSSKLKRKNNRR